MKIVDGRRLGSCPAYGLNLWRHRKGGLAMVLWRSALVLLILGAMSAAFAGQKFPLGPVFRVNSGNYSCVGERNGARTASGTAGNFVVVWAADGGPDNENEVRGQVYDEDERLRYPARAPRHLHETFRTTVGAEVSVPNPVGGTPRYSTATSGAENARFTVFGHGLSRNRITRTVARHQEIGVSRRYKG